MNVIKVEFEKRDSGITWISFKDESGAIEVYPLTTRNTEALRNFLNDPAQSGLRVADNFPPRKETATVCKFHGRHYNNYCPECPRQENCPHGLAMDLCESPSGTIDDPHYPLDNYQDEAPF